ncbi:MAG: D-alanyl-D-alanine carboxypeptidase family protein [Woeseia sp.]
MPTNALSLFELPDSDGLELESFIGSVAAGWRPVPIENPGGGRIQNKKDPPAADMETIDGHRGRQVPLHRLAAAAWRTMVAAARAAGIAAPLLLPISGYRSTKRQRGLFRKAVARYGSESAARKWVAPPGKSAHHSGRAIDLYLGYDISSRLAPKIRNTAAWRWLRDNAERFGFYPYENEPWHWEYNPPQGGAAAAARSGAGGVVGVIGSISRLPAILASTMSRGAEVAKVSAAIANGQRNENILTSDLFYARHPQRNRRKIGLGERTAAAEWLQIRNTIVRPLLAKIGTAASQGAAAGMTNSGSGGSAAQPSALGRLVEMKNGAEVWSYQFTPEDLLWTARLIVFEAGGGDNPDNAAVIQALLNRYALFTRRVFPSFAAFIRRYSTTLQPVLANVGAARRHFGKPGYVVLGGPYKSDPSVLKGQLRRHLDMQATPWSRLPDTARNLATRALTGQLRNPGIGLASEFASTRVYFRSHHGGREPSNIEWRDFTNKLATRKKWRWIGDVPGLNQQRMNAFFIDNRAAGRPATDVQVR